MILLVEDNEDDVFLMKRALKKAGVESPLHVCVDGQEAFDYLAGNCQFSDRATYPLPTLIFLDLKLPFVHGFEILSWLKEQPTLKHLPCAVLTSSPEERDQTRAQALGADAYFVKPPSADLVLKAWRSASEGSPVPPDPLVQRELAATGVIPPGHPLTESLGNIAPAAPPATKPLSGSA